MALFENSSYSYELHLCRLVASVRCCGIPVIDFESVLSRLQKASGGPIDRVVMHPKLVGVGSGSVGEMAALSALVAAKRPKNVLEFGTCDGCSTWHLWANSGPDTIIATIDFPPGVKAIGSTDPGLQRVAKRPFLPDDPRVRLVETDSCLWAPDIPDGVDLCFIDAGHSYECVKNDTEKALSVLKDDGVVLWHDATWKSDGYRVNEYLLGLIELQYDVKLIKVSNYDFSSLAVLFGNAPGGHEREKGEEGAKLVRLREDLAALLPPGAVLILADDDCYRDQLTADRRVLPFLERDGEYWGAPPDDATAIRELGRLRRAGASFLAFAWPAFWWLDYYVGFHRHLRSRFRCALENERLIVFDLRQEAAVAEAEPPLSRRAVAGGASAWSDFRRLTPVSGVFGHDRGRPIDRYYIEAFLGRHDTDVCGRVLEIGDPGYTRQFGGERVTQSDVLHAAEDNSQATIVGDLATGLGIPRDAFQCIILTQTLQYIYDLKAAVANCHAALKPGGVVLVTLPGISQIARWDADHWGDYWRFTPQSAARLFGDTFGSASVQVESHGNVLVACAFLHGLADHELTESELSYTDPDYPVLITVRAVRTC
jgi:predicted O-methyltransferase YrrM/SAM-dependent methyltransferase